MLRTWDGDTEDGLCGWCAVWDSWCVRLRGSRAKEVARPRWCSVAGSQAVLWVG